MENFVPLEIWAILAAAPCIISWFLGEMHGAARIRRMMDDDETPASRGSIGSAAELRNPSLPSLNATVQTDKRTAISAAHRLRVVEDGAAPTGHPARSEAVQARRRTAFDDMPSVAELHAQAQLIRKDGAVWDDPELAENMQQTDPISARVLQSYRGSINELARCNARLSDRASGPSDSASQN